MNRYRVGEDGRTAEERRTGKAWRKPIPLFGEKIMFKKAGSVGRKSDAAARMLEGRFVGLHNRFGSVLVLTRDGTQVGSSFHRLADDQKWSIDGINEVRGPPWNVTAPVQPMRAVADAVQAPPPIVVVQPGPQVDRPPDAAVAVREDVPAEPEVRRTPRAMPVKREYIEKFGITPGCSGCISVKRGFGQQIQHNEECRSRITLKISEEVQEQMRRRMDTAPEEPRVEVRANPSSSRPQKRKSEFGGEDEVVQDEPSSASRPLQSNVVSRSSSPTKRKPSVEADELREQTKDVEDAVDAAMVPIPSDQSDALVADASVLDLCSIERGIEEGEKQRYKAALEQMIADKYSRESVELSSGDAGKIAALSLSLGAVDVREVFSPSRFTSMASKFGLRRGVAVDLTEVKENGVEQWDLDKKEDRLEVEAIIENDQPWLVTGSPPCGPFSPLRRLTDQKRDPAVVEQELELARSRVRTACGYYRRQYDEGRFFLHEHPKPSGSWDMPEVREIANLPGVFLVESTMCHWSMTIPGREDEGYVRKPTYWLTNSKEIAMTLDHVCGRDSPVMHRHVQLIGGIAKHAQVYPVRLVKAVLQGLRRQLMNDGHLSSFEATETGPSPHEELWDTNQFAEEEEQFWDAAAGTLLDSKLVHNARAEELSWVKSEGIYKRVPLSECTSKGLKPVTTKWIDLNKGDDNNPRYRSRWVAREIKRAKKPEDQLSEVELFAATPPTELFMVICSLFMTKFSNNKGKKKLGSWDISRAHFMGRVERDLYIELPPEDLQHAEDAEPMCGKLERSMYGTQDAARIFQKDWTTTLEENDFEISQLCTATFRHRTRDMVGMVHGDDFLVMGSDEDLQFMNRVLAGRYKVRWEATLGDDVGDDKEMFFLNRLVKYDGQKLEIEADARHSEIIIRQLGLQDSKGLDTPEIRQTPEDVKSCQKDGTLTGELLKQFRSMTMRAAYLSQDRPDIANTVKNLARGMAQPKPYHWEKLKRLGRYLVKFPYAKRVFHRQQYGTVQLVGFTDSDWAGDLETRRSTTGLSICMGRHTILTKSNLQSVVSLSSAEAEYYGLCKGATTTMFLKHMLETWGYHVKMSMRADSSSAISLSSRTGVGKTKHVQARYLWLQQHTRDGSLVVEKVHGKKNPADLLTKVLDRKTIVAHLTRLNFERFCDRSAKQKKLLA